MAGHFVFVIDTFLGNPDQYEGVDDDELIGGAEINLYRTAQLLLDDGHDVTVYQRDTGNPNQTYDGIYIEYVSVPDLPPRARKIAFNLQWQRSVPDNAYVHIQSIEYAIPALTSIDSANQQGLTWDSPDGTGMTTRIKRYFTKRLLAQGAFVRASDNSFLTYLQSEHTPYRNQVYPIPNGVDTDRFTPEPVEPSQIGREGTDDLVVLFPRTLRIARGAHLLVDALARLRADGHDVTAWFLGAESVVDAPAVRARIDKNDIHEAVEFLGHVPHDRMHRYYNAADIVTIPTYHSEGSSIACLEAMACGKPLVVTDVGGLKELVYQDEVDGGYKVKPTAEALFEGMKRLVADPELRAELGSNARDRALAYYTIERWERQMRDYFRRVLGEGDQLSEPASVSSKKAARR